jgi:hypothetical protein
MKSKYLYLLAGLAIVIVLVSYSALTMNSLQPTQNNNSTGTVQKVEVIHFHPTQQCVSCIVMGDFAEDTIDTFFQSELASGKLVFMHINGNLANNSALVKKYGATGSSLWLGTYTSEGFYPEENIQVWYLLGNRTGFMEYLKGVIEDKLSGA